MLHRVVVKAEKTGLKAYSTGGQRSSRIASLNGANGFVILPQLKEGAEGVLRAKEMADAIIISELQMA
jgi:gephyrin